MIMHFNPAGHRCSLVPALVLCVVVIIGLTGTQTAAQETDTPVELTEPNPLLDQVVDVDFGDTPLSDAVALLAQKAELEVIESAPLSGRLTIEIKDVSRRNAIEICLSTYGLSSRIEGKTVWILPLAEQPNGEGKTITESIRIYSAHPQEVVDKINAEFGDTANITFDADTNTIVVTATPPNFMKIANTVRQLDVACQIGIEAMFVKAILRDEKQSGREWLTEAFPVFNKPYGLTSRGPGETPRKRVLMLDEDVQLRTLIGTQVNNGTAEILSNPVALTLDNTLAKIVLHSEIPYHKLMKSTTGPPVAPIEYDDVAATLEITPDAMFLDGTIKIDLKAEITLPVMKKDYTGNRVIDKTEIKITTRLEDDQTLCVTGLRREQNDKGQYTELLVFVTCNIVP